MFLIGKRIFIIEDNAGNLAIASVYPEGQAQSSNLSAGASTFPK